MAYVKSDYMWRDLLYWHVRASNQFQPRSSPKQLYITASDKPYDFCCFISIFTKRLHNSRKNSRIFHHWHFLCLHIACIDVKKNSTAQFPLFSFLNFLKSEPQNTDRPKSSLVDRPYGVWKAIKFPTKSRYTSAMSVDGLKFIEIARFCISFWCFVFLKSVLVDQHFDDWIVVEFPSETQCRLWKWVDGLKFCWRNHFLHFLAFCVSWNRFLSIGTLGLQKLSGSQLNRDAHCENRSTR